MTTNQHIIIKVNKYKTQTTNKLLNYQISSKTPPNKYKQKIDRIISPPIMY